MRRLPQRNADKFLATFWRKAAHSTETCIDEVSALSRPAGRCGTSTAQDLCQRLVLLAKAKGNSTSTFEQHVSNRELITHRLAGLSFA